MLRSDHALARTVDAYRTAEFATLTPDGTPIAWPTAILRGDDGTLLVTTSLAFPQKAVNVRRDGRVALLLSDPTGSGLPDPPQILIRGTATCPEKIHTVPEGELGRLWKSLFERQPGARAYLNVAARRFTDWYFMRLLITVTPTEITTAPRPAPGPGITDGPLLGAHALKGYGTAVLAATDSEGAPVLRRTTITSITDGYGVSLDEDERVAPGPASLLVHRHDEKLSALHNAVVRGRLARTGVGWVLTPEKAIEPMGRGPRDMVRTVRNCRAATKRYLDRRGLARPVIPWAEYRKLAGKR
ncbi:pyridoxamine 5'-phosphate oxidase family protein [Actinoplanes sp. NPDC048791]|uniref:pyridoxamine 5'-phosphate oxidase family protein n=1 Tax=Actinoplanes sp. NPDC048791 TaxID=3154623 RepID=UPI0033E30159